MRRRFFWVIFLSGLLCAAFATVPGEPRFPSLSDEQFQRVSLELSEPPGYFGTDNLVSNETSFLHVREFVRANAVPGFAYIGVGPDQNFTYISEARPSVAYIIDIRRDNLLHHLFYKAIMMNSRDRWDFMSMLFGKPIVERADRSEEADAADLVEYFQSVSSDRIHFTETFNKMWGSLRDRYPTLVSESDQIKLLSIAVKFFEDGLDVRYEIPGRPMLSFFPSFSDLMLETDLEGHLGHYLNSEEDFQFLKTMQEENRIIPIVGNFSGIKALRAVGAHIRSQDLKVSVFYLSNVEFYLFRNRTYRRFVANLHHLPIDERSLLIRSYFNNWFGTWRTHPNAVQNYFSTSLAQSFSRFLRLDQVSPYTNYWEMVNRDYLGVAARSSSVLD